MADLRGATRCIYDGSEIIKIQFGESCIWPDPWIDLWDDGSVVYWENAWRDSWSVPIPTSP